MEFRLILTGCFAVGFAAQLLLMLKSSSRLPRFIPLILIAVSSAYALMRMFGVISYPGDGSGFIDVGGLVGLVLLCFIAAFAAGCLFGFLTDRIIVCIKKKKQKATD